MKRPSLGTIVGVAIGTVVLYVGYVDLRAAYVQRGEGVIVTQPMDRHGNEIGDPIIETVSERAFKRYHYARGGFFVAIVLVIGGVAVGSHLAERRKQADRERWRQSRAEAEAKKSPEQREREAAENHREIMRMRDELWPPQRLRRSSP